MRIAALDVGSNTVLMLVAECSAGTRPTVLADLARITRLGRGVDAKGYLDPSSADLTLATIVEFTAEAKRLGADRILGVATAALRDAADGSDFLRQVWNRTGLSLEIITGHAEAELSYLATQKSLEITPSEKFLIVDIGGGSTELIRAGLGETLTLVSLQLGSVRLTERIVYHDPPSVSEAESLRELVDHSLRQLGWNYEPRKMVGIAGTVATLCAIQLGLTHYKSEIVQGATLAARDVRNLVRLLGSIPLAQRQQLPGMDVGRADVLFAGAVILERIMNHFGCEKVIVSDQGVRWGLVWRELESHSNC
jgi:exopolyphosphatase/guanosine-5'-triphosphate,3'-diphosphate pyrophosphatase